MQRYHDPSIDPLPQRSSQLEAEARRIALATEAFLANGGQIEQVGHQMKSTSPTFVIDPSKTPVYAHLFAQPEAEPVRAKPADVPVTAPAEPVVEAQVQPQQPTEPPVSKPQAPALKAQQLAARMMVQAALGASPKAAADALGISEKHARQVARDYHITFQRQR